MLTMTMIEEEIEWMIFCLVLFQIQPKKQKNCSHKLLTLILRFPPKKTEKTPCPLNVFRLSCVVWPGPMTLQTLISKQKHHSLASTTWNNDAQETHHCRQGGTMMWQRSSITVVSTPAALPIMVSGSDCQTAFLSGRWCVSMLSS